MGQIEKTRARSGYFRWNNEVFNNHLGAQSRTCRNLLNGMLARDTWDKMAAAVFNCFGNEDPLGMDDTLMASE